MRRWVSTVCVLIGGFGAACSAPERPRPVARNLVLLSLDTLRPDHTGAYGHSTPTSPHLDRLTRESVLLGRLRSHAPETRDAHMAVFTSQYTFVHRRVGALPTLAEQLRSVEFATAGFTDGGEVSHSFGFDRGFEIYVDQGGGLDRHVAAFDRWLDERKPERFFAFLHTYEIHDPYHPGEPFESLFHPGYTGSVTGAQSQPLLQSIRGIGPYHRGGYEVPVLDAEDRRQMTALYDGGIRKTDEAVGRLYEMLRSRGLLQDTLLVVISDHGEEFWEHGSVLHAHTLYQELLAVVGIVRLPGAASAGTIRWSPVQGIDLAPSLLGLLGAPPLPTAEGTAVQFAQEESQERAWYAEKRTNFALTLGRHKYIGEMESPRYEIYDLLEDPGEVRPMQDEELARSLLAEVSRVRGRIRNNLTAFRKDYPARPAAAVDSQTLEQLRRLGYIE